MTEESLTITLPKIDWADAASVSSYLATIIGTIVTLLTLLHPGFTVPAIAEAVIVPVSSVIAGVAQIANLIWHRKVQIAALARP